MLLGDLRRFYMKHFAPPPLVPARPAVPPFELDGDDAEAREESERMARSRQQRIEAEATLARLRAGARAQTREPS